MKLCEVFYSIQGEGKLAGVPSAFIRTSGCNLRCTWCDTPYSSWSPEGEDWTLEAILSKLAEYPTRHVVVTGGEPMIAPQIGELTAALRGRGYHVTLETAATVWREVVCDLASLSPKLANSTPWQREGGRFADAHQRGRIDVEVIRRFIRTAPAFQLKFVVDAPHDLAEIDQLLARLGDVSSDHVLLMPQGATAAETASRGRWIADLCKTRGFRFCPRLHLELYGNQRGT